MGGAEGLETPISLFYSYSHRDEAFRDELKAHLSFLRRSKLIAEWHDRMIDAGGDWRGEIDKHLASADIVLLLVSADFLASDYCWGEEMVKALSRHQLGEARVIPVISAPVGGRARRSAACRSCRKMGSRSANAGSSWSPPIIFHRLHSIGSHSLPSGPAIEEMLADYQVMPIRRGSAGGSVSERRLRPFGTPPLRTKADAGCGFDLEVASAAETAGTTVNVAGLAIAVLQLEATPILRRRAMAIAG